MSAQQGQYFAAEPPRSARPTLAAEVVSDDLTELAQQLFGQLAPRLDLGRIKELPEERRGPALTRAPPAPPPPGQPPPNTPPRGHGPPPPLDGRPALGPPRRPPRAP